MLFLVVDYVLYVVVNLQGIPGFLKFRQGELGNGLLIEDVLQMFKLFDTVVRKDLLKGIDHLEKLTVKAYWRISTSVGPLVGAE